MAEMFKNEGKIRTFGIPLLGLLITSFFYLGQPEVTLKDLALNFLINTIVTFLYWQGNVSIFNNVRNHYPLHLTKRILLTLAISLCYNSFVSLAIHVIFHALNDVPVSHTIFWVNLGLGMGFTLIIGAIYEIIFYFNKWKESLLETEKLRRDFINAEYETLKNQVNPHFLFNSMNALSSLVHSDPDKAEQFIDEFCKIYRYVLDRKDEVVVTLKEELEFVKSFLFLQKIRFGNSLQVEINIAGELMNAFLPPVSLQLLVENAIKHNRVTPEAPLVISIHNEEDLLVVQNNLQHRREIINSTGVGLKNLQAKYKIISDHVPEFLVKENHYIARLPLIKEEKYEGIDH